jgi:hypothetical protein
VKGPGAGMRSFAVCCIATLWNKGAAMLPNGTGQQSRCICLGILLLLPQ